MYVFTIKVILGALLQVFLILYWLGVEGGNPAGRWASVRGGYYILH